jgi:hypothetical protein
MDRVKVIKRSIPCILGFTICPFLHSFIRSHSWHIWRGACGWTWIRSVAFASFHS